MGAESVIVFRNQVRTHARVASLTGDVSNVGESGKSRGGEHPPPPPPPTCVGWAGIGYGVTAAP
jgi:hypothetical protein